MLIDYTLLVSGRLGIKYNVIEYCMKINYVATLNATAVTLTTPGHTNLRWSRSKSGSTKLVFLFYSRLPPNN